MRNNTHVSIHRKNGNIAATNYWSDWHFLKGIHASIKDLELSVLLPESGELIELFSQTNKFVLTRGINSDGERAYQLDLYSKHNTLLTRILNCIDPSEDDPQWECHGEAIDLSVWLPDENLCPNMAYIVTGTFIMSDLIPFEYDDPNSISFKQEWHYPWIDE